MKRQSETQEQFITASVPEHNHQQLYKKAEMFSFISNHHLSNYICMPLCGVFWVGGFIYANENKISPIQVNFTRYLAQLISTILILKIRNQGVDFKNARDYKMLILRSTISGLNGLAASFFQMYLPLTVYYTLNASMTIFAFLLNHFLYGVHFTMNQRKAVIVGMMGIALVVNGRVIYQFLDSSYEFQSKFDYSSTDLYVQLLVGVLSVVWACVWAYGIVITGKHHASFHQFIFINTMVGYFMFSIGETILFPVESAGSLSMLFITKPEQIWKTFIYGGVPLAAANYIFNAGMFLTTNTGVSSMLTQVNILYVYLISTLRYNQSINYICLLGSFLLIGCIYVTLFKK